MISTYTNWTLTTRFRSTFFNVQMMPQGPTPQMSSPTKDVNTASLCSVGQQAVQDLVQKTQEVFKLLKDFQVK